MGNLMNDNNKRFETREALEAAGCIVTGYHKTGMSIAIKRGCTCEINSAAKILNGKLSDRMFYFPLGSDNPPDEFRHDGGYPGSKGFWLYGSVDFA